MRVRKDNHVILVKNLQMMAEMCKFYSVSVSITLPDKVHTIGLLKSFVGYSNISETFIETLALNLKAN